MPYCHHEMREKKKIPPKWIFELQFNYDRNYLVVIAKIAWCDDVGEMGDV